jgi:hypothetical protein
MSSIYEAQCGEALVTIERLESLLANLPSEQTFNRLSLDLRLSQMKLIQKWMREIKTQFEIEVPA